MAQAFDFRDGVGGPDWETARGYLVEQFDRLYAGLQPVGPVGTGAPVALGGGAASTVGTIGGLGPARAAQAGWLKFTLLDGTTAFVPYWT